MEQRRSFEDLGVISVQGSEAHSTRSYPELRREFRETRKELERRLAPRR